MSTSERVMLLIDADNVSVDVMEQAVRLVHQQHGGLHVRRAYCTAESAVKHQAVFKRLSIKPMVNLAAGKNSTDIALAVDAIDLVLAERPDVVVIASSDSDFAPLVQRLREKGCVVRGIGQKGKTGDETQEVYDDFTVLEHRKSESAAPARKAPARKAVARKAVAAKTPAAAKAPAKKAAARKTPASAETAAPPPPAAAQPPAEPNPAPPTEKPARKVASKKAAGSARKTSNAAAKALPEAAERSAVDAAERPAAEAGRTAAPAPATSAPKATRRASARTARKAASESAGVEVPAGSPLPPAPAADPRVDAVLAVLPELAAGQSLALNVAVQRLREAQLLGRNTPSTRFFAALGERFELRPAGNPSQVRLRR